MYLRVLGSAVLLGAVAFAAPAAAQNKLDSADIVRSLNGVEAGAAINPARYLGTVFMQAGFGGTVSWAQVPAYLIGEFVGGVLGALAWVGIGRVRADAAFTSLAPADDPAPEKVSGATS